MKYFDALAEVEVNHILVEGLGVSMMLAHLGVREVMVMVVVMMLVIIFLELRRHYGCDHSAPRFSSLGALGSFRLQFLRHYERS